MEENAIRDTVGLVILAALAVILLGSIIYTLSVIVMCRQIKLVGKCCTALASSALFFSCFIVFYFAACYLFIPSGFMMD